MGRLRGLGSFFLVAAGATLLARVIHVGVPLFFPETRPGPFALASLAEVERRAGFAPLVPAYRPETLGSQPPTLTLTLGPNPTLEVLWRGERALRIVERHGGAGPEHPPFARPLDDVPESSWWQEGARQHLVLRRGHLWLEVETDLPARDLRRIADTLGPP